MTTRRDISKRLADLAAQFGNPGDALSLEAVVACGGYLRSWLQARGYPSAAAALAAGETGPDPDVCPITIFDLAEAERRVEAHRLSCAGRR
jgi:hypothetical protein